MRYANAFRVVLLDIPDESDMISFRNDLVELWIWVSFGPSPVNNLELSILGGAYKTMSGQIKLSVLLLLVIIFHKVDLLLVDIIVDFEHQIIVYRHDEFRHRNFIILFGFQLSLINLLWNLLFKFICYLLIFWWRDVILKNYENLRKLMELN